MPADGTSAFEQVLHDLVYVRVEQARAGQSVWPCESCTPESAARLSVTGPQYELGTSTASRYTLSLPGYCISRAVAPLGPEMVKSVVLSCTTGCEKVTRNRAEGAVVVGAPLGYDI